MKQNLLMCLKEQIKILFIVQDEAGCSLEFRKSNEKEKSLKLLTSK